MYIFVHLVCMCAMYPSAPFTRSPAHPPPTKPSQMYYSYQKCTAPPYKPFGLPKTSASHCRIAFYIDHPVPNAVLRYRLDELYYGDARFYLSFSPLQVQATQLEHTRSLAPRTYTLTRTHTNALTHAFTHALTHSHIHARLQHNHAVLSSRRLTTRIATWIHST